ncbi:MAG: metallophosphatase family protein [Chitinophagaceae bacterium]|nr:metallophosphatase family protein [Chitinophagaceae bacterium]
MLTRIGLISDTHGFLDEKVFEHFDRCDEVWHAGDLGPGVLESLQSFKPLRAVYGNIDDADIRHRLPEQVVFECEQVKVLMRHIGGAPHRYNPETKKELLHYRPQLFVCGHSHILKIRFDEKISCLYMNPGAAGRQGWHTVRTLIRFTIHGKEIANAEVIELGAR